MADDEIPPEPAEVPADPLATLTPPARALLERIDAELGDAVVARGSARGELVVRVRPEAWARVATISKGRLECDFLSFVSAIDWMPAPNPGGDDAAGGDTSTPVQPRDMTFGVAGSDGRLQVFARVQSTTRHWGVTYKTDVDEARPAVASWTGEYPGASWHERETWEMFGIVFDGHPDLRHLYLPFEFEGHPLRKDFPLLARELKPWPGLVDVEPMPEDPVEGESSESPPQVAGAEA